MPRQTPGILVHVHVASVCQLSVYPCSWLNLQKIGICFGLFSPTWSVFFTNMKYYFLIFPWIKKTIPCLYFPARAAACTIYTRKVFFWASTMPVPPSILWCRPSFVRRSSLKCHPYYSCFIEMQLHVQRLKEMQRLQTPLEIIARSGNCHPVLGRSSKDRDFFVHSRNFICFKLYYG